MKKRARSKQSIVAIADWQRADEILKDLGDLVNTISTAEANAKDEIDRIKESLKQSTASAAVQIDILTNSLQAFCAAHAEDFGGAKSRKLQFGTVGWRSSTAIKIANAKDTVDQIKVVFGKKAETYLRIKEEPDKDSLAKLTDEQLDAVGCRREKRDVFFAEPELIEAIKY
ncbi:host-nuclease inhibitor Gam family protein [Anaerohalosphaeraceae bacterium U12dextr]